MAQITMPRWLGPVAKTVLRSPAHGLMSGSLLLLTVRGRRSGRDITLPVGYDDDRSGLLIVASEPETKNWWRNLSPQLPVRALVRGTWREFTPEVTRWHDDSAAAFESAFAHYLERFTFIADRLGVTRTGDTFDEHALRTAARKIVMVHLTPLTSGTA